MSFGTPRILYPERSIQLAKNAAMNTLLHLMKAGIDDLPEIYDNSRTLWEEAKMERERLNHDRDPDRFVPICDAEKHLRKNFLAYVFNTTALYGNKEVKRIYSWKEGTIGPLNVLLNRAGAQLRFLGMTRYPFPTPHRKNIRRRDKSGKEYSQSDPVYGGTRQRPTTVITHPTLPSLDFVDAIRGHLVELCRQCFIHSVSISDTSKYINLLIFRLRPLLDKFYLAGFDKKRRTVRFTERSLAALESVVAIVKGQHGFTIGYPSRMTEYAEDIDFPSLGTKALFDKVDDSKIRQVLKKKKDDELIGDDDTARFSNEIVTTVSRVGTRIHRRMAWGTTQPFSAKSVMLSGDVLARDKTGYLLTAEVPVNARRGKVDYTLFVRKVPEYMEEDSSSVSGLWVPRLVLDLKTKTAFDWGVIAKPQDQTKSYIVDFPLKRRALTDTEWDTIIKNTPDATELRQVESYAHVLLQEYKAIARDDLDPPDSSLKGIILVDGHDFPSRSRRVLPRFVKAVFEYVRRDISELQSKDPGGKIEYPRTLFEPTFRWPLKTRIAIVIFPFTLSQGVSVQNILPQASPQQSLVELNPFENRKEDLGHFILYLTGDDISSPGDSAGWIAQHWNGLQFAYELAKEHGHKSVVWIDLAGQFTDDMIRPAVLRLGFHHDRVRQFYKSISFLDLSVEIEKALFSGEKLLSAEAIQTRIKDYDFIIVSGLDSIRQLVPTELEGLVDTLAVHVAEAASRKESCILWFGSPSPLATCSDLYKRHQLRPFRYDSPLQPYIDEIILNIPLPPRKGGSEVPKHDHVRGLVSLGPEQKRGLDCTTIGTPPLIGWSNQFLTRKPSDKEQELMSKLRTRPPNTSRWLKTHGYPAFNEDWVVELFPFTESWCQGSKTAQRDRNLDSLDVKSKMLVRKRGKKGDKGMLTRLTFSKEMCKPSPRKINTRRRQRTIKLELEPLGSVSLPPHSSELVYSGFSSSDAGMIELTRLQDAILFLLEHDECSPPLKEQCLELLNALTRPESLTHMDTLQSISDVCRKSRYISQIWYRLLWGRDWLEGWPMPVGMKKDIARLQVGRKGILQYFGNYLVLMIASLAEYYTLHQTEIQALWNMVRPWVIMQLGARPRTGKRPISEFDTRTVYEHLKAKVRHWNSVPYPVTTVLSNVRYGLRIDLTKSNPTSYRWYVFEDGAYSSRFIAGCIEMDSKRSSSWSLIRGSAVTSLDEIGALTDFKFSDCRIRPILIAGHQGIDVLYEADRQLFHRIELNDLTGLDSSSWRPVGMMRYGTRSRYAPARLRYIKVLTLGMKYPSIHDQRLPVRQAKFGEGLLEHIRTIGSMTSGVTRVKCSLTGTLDSGSMSFKVYDTKRWRKVGQSIDYKDIDQAAQVLLLPYNVGTAIQGRYTWDPITDVHLGPGGERLKKIIVSRVLLDREEGV